MNNIRKLYRIHIQSSQMENNNKMVVTRFKHYKSKHQTTKNRPKGTKNTDTQEQRTKL